MAKRKAPKSGAESKRLRTRAQHKKKSNEDKTAAENPPEEDKDSNAGTSQAPESAQEGTSNDTAEPARPDSPDPSCSICLCDVENKSFTDSCFHTFCFVCLVEWSKVKAVCPLCKQPFKSIIHNVRSLDDYDRYNLPEEPSAAERFRYRTTLTGDRLEQRQQGQSALRRPNRTSAQIAWQRRRQVSTSAFRRRIYTLGMRVQEITTPAGQPVRYREIGPAWFRRYPASTHRLVPWLNRELNVLLHNDENQVTFLLELILDIIKRFDIQSPEFNQHVVPFLGRRTDHFIHEFYMFARSPSDIINFDRHAIYQEPSVNDPIHTLPSSSSSSDSEDDDVIIVPTSTEAAGNSNPMSSLRGASPSRSDPQDTRSRDPLSFSPILRRVQDFLQSTDRSRPWDSPTPGPSNFWSSSSFFSPLTSLASLPTLNDLSAMYPGSSAPSASLGQPVFTSRSPASSHESDIVVIGEEKPWRERSPIAVLSSDTEPDVAVLESTTKKQKSKHKKSKKSKKRKKSKDRRSSSSRRDRERRREERLKRREDRHRHRSRYLLPKSPSGHRASREYSTSRRSADYTSHQSRSSRHGTSRDKSSSGSSRYSKSHQRSREEEWQSSDSCKSVRSSVRSAVHVASQRPSDSPVQPHPDVTAASPTGDKRSRSPQHSRSRSSSKSKMKKHKSSRSRTPPTDRAGRFLENPTRSHRHKHKKNKASRSKDSEITLTRRASRGSSVEVIFKKTHKRKHHRKHRRSKDSAVIDVVNLLSSDDEGVRSRETEQREDNEISQSQKLWKKNATGHKKSSARKSGNSSSNQVDRASASADSGTAGTSSSITHEPTSVSIPNDLTQPLTIDTNNQGTEIDLVSPDKNPKSTPMSPASVSSETSISSYHSDYSNANDQNPAYYSGPVDVGATPDNATNTAETLGSQKNPVTFEKDDTLESTKGKSIAKNGPEVKGVILSSSESSGDDIQEIHCLNKSPARAYHWKSAMMKEWISSKHDFQASGEPAIPQPSSPKSDEEFSSTLIVDQSSQSKPSSVIDVCTGGSKSPVSKDANSESSDVQERKLQSFMVQLKDAIAGISGENTEALKQEDKEEVKDFKPVIENVQGGEEVGEEMQDVGGKSEASVNPTTSQTDTNSHSSSLSCAISDQGKTTSINDIKSELQTVEVFGISDVRSMDCEEYGRQSSAKERDDSVKQELQKEVPDSIEEQEMELKLCSEDSSEKIVLNEQTDLPLNLSVEQLSVHSRQGEPSDSTSSESDNDTRKNDCTDLSDSSKSCDEGNVTVYNEHNDSNSDSARTQTLTPENTDSAVKVLGGETLDTSVTDPVCDKSKQEHTAEPTQSATSDKTTVEQNEHGKLDSDSKTHELSEVPNVSVVQDSVRECEQDVFSSTPDQTLNAATSHSKGEDNESISGAQSESELQHSLHNGYMMKENDCKQESVHSPDILPSKEDSNKQEMKMIDSESCVLNADDSSKTSLSESYPETQAEVIVNDDVHLSTKLRDLENSSYAVPSSAALHEDMA